MAVGTISIGDRIKAYLARVAEARDLEARAKDARKEARKIELEICDYLVDQDIPKITIKEGASVSLSETPRASVLKADEPKLLDWIRRRGDDHIITEGVHHKRLASYLQSLREEGITLPTFIKTSLQLGLHARFNGYSPDSPEGADDV